MKTFITNLLGGPAFVDPEQIVLALQNEKGLSLVLKGNPNPIEIECGHEDASTFVQLLADARQAYKLDEDALILKGEYKLVGRNFMYVDPYAPEVPHDDVRSMSMLALEQECMALVRDSRKIQAIKLYRDETDLGLKESKDAVERWMKEWGL